ncbi:MAG: hypothetical protein M3169_15000, partial [Candidatus Eremiobacteraeota bacterium]|nr:hypothetical protein [Candidatus Eremiobacteraeota bacterium]
MKCMLAGLFLTCALTACGGGVSVPTSPPPADSLKSKTGLVTLTITVPPTSTRSTGRRPVYVSPGTQSVSVTPQGGTPQVFAITANSPNCTSSGGALTCTFSASLPVGQNEVIAISTYANAAGTGVPLSTGAVTTTVVSGAANALNATLGGVVAAVSVVLNPMSVATGTARTVQVIVNALDASNNTIVGPDGYVDAGGNPVTITLTDADSSSSTTLSQASIAKPTSGITLAYNGSSSFTGATVTGTASNGPQKSGALAAAGAITRFVIPSGNRPSVMTAGPDGNVWFTEEVANKIGRITPSGTVTEFPIPTAGSTPEGITAGPDGNLWFTEFGANKIGRITPAGIINEFVSPAHSAIGNGLTRIAKGSDGNLWFTERYYSAIGRITPGGTITEFPIPKNLDANIFDITAGPGGNLWFTFPTGIGKITPDGAITEFINSTANIYFIAAGADGNLWTSNSQFVTRVTPSGTFTSFPITRTSNAVDAVTAGPDGNVWFTDS